MAKEEEKGYSVSDQQVDKDGFGDAHRRALNSSHPAMSNLKHLGLTGELSGIEPDTAPLAEDTAARIDPQPIAEATDQLSGFTRWLVQLDRPTVHPHEATIDEVESHEQTNETTAPVKTDERSDNDGVPDIIAEKKKKKKRKKKKKADKKKSTSDQTIELSEDVFSETLAELLASQGHVAEAISMYEKLRLKYPEKSRFFAAKIEELNKKA